MKALIIDDSKAMRRILASIVREVGFEIVEAGGVKEALAALGERKGVDVMLVDWNLPDGEGVDIVREVRAQGDFEGTMVVMITSETSRERMSEAIQAGANEYITKPFDREALLEKLGLLGMIRA